MSEYNPDKWAIIKLEIDGVLVHKVLGGWSGGYLDGDSWRLSSGLESVETEGNYYLMKNYSGSVYKCHKNANGFNVISGEKFTEFEDAIKEKGGTIESISVDDFLKEKKVDTN